MSNSFRAATLGLRKRLPPWLRRPIRLARHVVNAPKPSPPLPPELFGACRVCSSRIQLLHHLQKGARVAEVGVDQGVFSADILRVCAPTELHLIDLNVAAIADAVKGDARVRVHGGLSQHMLAQFADGYFDWIYIDADHSYAGVVRDIAAAAPKVRSGGMLVFNDFAHVDPDLGVYGVHRAVCEFAAAKNWRFAWWAYDTHGLYDVALQRP